MPIKFFHRSGKPVTEAAVRRAQMNWVKAKRTGKLGPMTVSIQPNVADSVERMSLTEFCRYSGAFTYKSTRR